ncbi:MAG: glycerol kinase GlpK [Sphaerochaetaceae bacterium]
MHYIGALDQGTTSTRFILFDRKGLPKASHQIEHTQIFVKPGWVEHDPTEIWANSVAVIVETLKKGNIEAHEVAGIGITNQRETIIAWEPATGRVRYNAIVWQDLRGAEQIEALRAQGVLEEIQERSGLVASAYFSASKISWLLANIEGLRSDAEQGRVVFGTIDAYLLWKFTGGTVVTDVTNASRYMLMNINTLEWDDWLLATFNIPKASLPQIVPSFGAPFGLTSVDNNLSTPIPIGGVLGDQQAALFGQACFSVGEGKNTFGTGCFLLVNTGERPRISSHGLLTTVAYQKAGEKAQYALEGSVAVAGSLVQWVRDNLKLVKSAPEVTTLAGTVQDNGGVYIVPAFSGLFAPYWRSDARGVIAGLTGYASDAHICRAALEATAFQVKDLCDAMASDGASQMELLKADGGLTNSHLLMAFQADLLGIPIVVPRVAETTALGAAYAAGLTVGFFTSFEEIAAQWQEDLRWTPTMGEEEKREKLKYWKKAVERTLNWTT